MSEAKAWLLDFGEGLLAAVGELEITHMLTDVPELFEIPLCPAYCKKVLVWQGKILPLMDIASRILDYSIDTSRHLVAIAAFQEYSGADVQHGALLLHAPPERISVDDSQACDLSNIQSSCRQFVLACFEHVNFGPVPVLDLYQVFSSPHCIIDDHPTDELASNHYTVQI